MWYAYVYTGCPKANVTHENACHFVNCNAIVFIFQIYTAEKIRRKKQQSK